MPLLRIQTNHPFDPAAQQALITQASQAVADMLGKPERYVMVSLEQNPAMLFAGSGAPLAYLELKSIGLPRNKTADLSRRLTTLLGNAAGLPADRVYIEFSDAAHDLWGWNGATF